MLSMDARASAHASVQPLSRLRDTKESTRSSKQTAHIQFPAQWSPQDCAVWLRGVDKLPRDALEAVIARNVDGQALLNFSVDDLADLGVDKVGQQCSVLASIDSLLGLEAHLLGSPVGLLGTKLLSGGRNIDNEPLHSVTAMVAALTSALHVMDESPPEDIANYKLIRQQLLDVAMNFVVMTRGTVDVAPSNQHYVQQAKDFVRELLPGLQQLRSVTAADEGTGQDISSFVQTVNVTVPSGQSAGLSIKAGSSGLIYISSIAPGKPVDKNGMLRIGDEIIMLNGQNIVGWRTRSVAALMKQLEEPNLSFTVKMSTAEFDLRIGRLMQQARALRNSMGQSFRHHSSSAAGGHSRSNSLTSQTPSDLRHYSVTSGVSSMGGGDDEAPVRITSPSAGEIIPAGSRFSITWASQLRHAGATVKLRIMSKGNSATRVIDAAAPHTGAYEWKVPADLPEGRDYQIVLALSAPGHADVLAISPKITISECNPGTLGRRKSTIRPKKAVLKRSGSAGNFGFEWDGYFISDIEINGPAHRDGVLTIGDQIVLINDKAVHGMSHLALAMLIESCGNELTIGVIPNVEGYKRYLEGFNTLHHKYKDKLVCRKVNLPGGEQDVEAFGMALQAADSILVVAAVHKGCAAAGNRHLVPNTCLVQINGMSTCGASGSQGLQYLELHKDNQLAMIVTHDTDIYAEYAHQLLDLRKTNLRPEGECDDIIRTASRWSLRRASTKNMLPRTNSSVSHRSRSNSVRHAVARTLSFKQDKAVVGRKADGSDIVLDGRELNIPCALIDQPEAAGWLTKQGGSGLTPKNWRRRWFVLKHGVVMYYKHPYDDKALGAVALPGFMIMPAPPGKRMHNRFGFKVAKEGSRSYYICADDAEDMKRWMNAMSLAAIQYKESDIGNIKWNPREPSQASSHRISSASGGSGNSASSHANSRSMMKPVSGPSTYSMGRIAASAAAVAAQSPRVARAGSGGGGYEAGASPNTAINRAVAAAHGVRRRSTSSRNSGSHNGSRKDMMANVRHSTVC